MFSSWRLENSTVINGEVRYFGLLEWYRQLSARKRELLRMVRPGLDSDELLDTSETVDEFLSDCARDVEAYDPALAEELFCKALDLSSGEQQQNVLFVIISSLKKSVPVKAEYAMNKLLEIAGHSELGFDNLLRLAVIYREQSPETSESLLQKALVVAHDPFLQHRTLREMADYYQHINDSERWFRIIQDELALLPDYMEVWLTREESSQNSSAWSQQGDTNKLFYPAVAAMVQIHRNRGDLPEALALCKEALKLGLLGDWERQVEELQLRMLDS